METLEDVFLYLSEIIIGDMYLYTSPPVKRMDKQMKQTLSAL
jgi:hypothetical protein